MNEQLMQITVRIDASDDADAYEIDSLTAELRHRLLELDVQMVEPVRAGRAPAGTRAGDPFTLGGLLVTLATSPELLKGAIGTIQEWLGTRAGKTVELEIDGKKIKLTGISSEQQQRLIDLFVEQQAR